MLIVILFMVVKLVYGIIFDFVYIKGVYCVLYLIIVGKILFYYLFKIVIDFDKCDCFFKLMLFLGIMFEMLNVVEDFCLNDE